MSETTTLNLTQFEPVPGPLPQPAYGKHRVVKFVTPGGKCCLNLEGPWKMTAGIHPDVNRAVASYKEYAKLPDPSAVGQVQFFYNSLATPDVTIAGIRIVEAEPLRHGLTPEDVAAAAAAAAAQGGGYQPPKFPGRFTEYRLYFADAREGFVLPRGGRLTLGLINPSKAAKPVSAMTPVSMTLTDLINACLTAMGITLGGPLPANLAKIDPPQDLKWLGSHAPSELAKLLERADACLVLKPDGTWRIYSIGSGDGPEYPPDQVLPIEPGLGDRRGKTVVFTSYPTQIASTFNIEPGTVAYGSDDGGQGASGGDWIFVYPSTPDAHGNVQFVPIDFTTPPTNDHTSKYGPGSSPLGPNATSKINNKYAGLSAGDAQDAWATAYTYIQLDPTVFEPTHGPVWRQTFGDPPDDGSTPPLIDIKVQSAIAVRDPSTGLWNNSSGLVNIHVEHILEPNVLKLSARLGTISGPPTADYDSVFTPIFTNTQLGIRWTRGKTRLDDEGIARPVYYVIGFTRVGSIAPGAAALTKLDSAAATAAMSDRDTLVVPLPDLLLVEINGDAVNQASLDNRCQQYASRYLADPSNTPQILPGKGFFSFGLNGYCNQIEWDQRALTTRVSTLGWYRPSSGYLAKEVSTGEAGGGGGGGRKTGAAEAFPHESKTTAQLTALGATGAVQPAVPVQPQWSGVPLVMPGLILVKLLKDGGSDGNGVPSPPVYASWTYTISDFNTGTVLANQVPLMTARQHAVQTITAEYGLATQTPLAGTSTMTVAQPIAAGGNGAGAAAIGAGVNPNGGPQPYVLVWCDESFGQAPCDTTAGGSGD